MVTLYMGEDIVLVENNELLQSSEPSLKKLRKAIEESQLPMLLQGVLTGGWDALGQPLALMDCPTAQVPQIPSAHGHSRVTVTVLLSTGAILLSRPGPSGSRCSGLEQGFPEETPGDGRRAPGRWTGEGSQEDL